MFDRIEKCCDLYDPEADLVPPDLLDKYDRYSLAIERTQTCIYSRYSSATAKALIDRCRELAWVRAESATKAQENY